MAGRDLRVGGRGGQYLRLGDAIAASQDGDVVQVRAGTYVNDFATITHRITIVAVGGPVRLEATQPIPNGKGILIVRNDATIEGLVFTGAQVTDHNGAGIRYEAGNLTIRNCVFTDNENGILASPSPQGTITIERSEFARNGYGDGQTHGIYVNNVQHLRVVDSNFHDTKVGHHIKSRAQATTVEGSRLDDGAGGTSSYSIDLPNGGVAVVRANTLIQSATGQNPAMIAFGAEGNLVPGSSLTVLGNRFENALPSGVGVRNFTPIVVEVRDNVTVDLPTLVIGPSQQSGNSKGQRSFDTPDDAPLDTAADPAATQPPGATDGHDATAAGMTATAGADSAPAQAAAGADGENAAAGEVTLVGVAGEGAAAALGGE